MNETVSIAKLQSQVDRMVDIINETETGRRIWEEAQRKQKQESLKEAKSILDLLKKDIDKNIERLQTCQRILNTLKIGTFDEMTEYSFDRLEELVNNLQDTLKANDVMIRELALDLKY